MTRLLGVVAVAFATAFLTAADDEKAIKADVTIGNDAKTGTAKAGQMVEIQVQYPVVPPFPSDFNVTVDGKKVKFQERNTQVLRDGRPMIGVTNRSIYLTAEGNGKQKVVIEYKKGTETMKKEVELTVKP